VTCLDFVLLMIRSRTRIFCFVHERLGYVTSNIAQKNIRSHLRCSLEGGKDTVGSSSRAVWSRQPAGRILWGAAAVLYGADSRSD
jgi:hypothetical protein